MRNHILSFVAVSSLCLAWPLSAGAQVIDATVLIEDTDGQRREGFNVAASGSVVLEEYASNSNWRLASFVDGVRAEFPIPADNSNEVDGFRRVMAVHPDGTVAIGAAGADDGAGAVYIYHRDENGFELRQTIAGMAQDELGVAVALADDMLAIGTQRNGARNGRVTIYERADASADYVEVARFDGGNFWILGAALAFDGETLAACAYNYSNPLQWQGAVLVYRRDQEGRWSQSQRIENPVPHRSDFYGGQLAASNGMLAISKAFSNLREWGVGAAVDIWVQQPDGTYVFETSFQRSSTLFTQSFRWRSPPVELQGNTLTVAWPFVEGGAGSVSVYAKQGANWYDVAQLDAPSAQPEARFGWGTALDGERLYVGEPYGGAVGNGALHMYRLDLPPAVLAFEPVDLGDAPPPNTVAGTLRVIDPNPDDTHVLEVTFPDAGYYIDGDTLIVEEPTPGEHDVVVQATDRSGWFALELVRVSIGEPGGDVAMTDVAEPDPSGTDTSTIDASNGDSGVPPTADDARDEDGGCCAIGVRRAPSSGPWQWALVALFIASFGVFSASRQRSSHAR